MITEYSLFHLETTYIMFGNLREIFGISNSNIFEFCAVSAVSERTDRGPTANPWTNPKILRKMKKHFFGALEMF